MVKKQKVPEETQVLENKKISIDYVSTRDIWNRNNVIVDEIFFFTVALEITRSDEDSEPQTINNVDVDMIGQNEKKQYMQN